MSDATGIALGPIQTEIRVKTDKIAGDMGQANQEVNKGVEKMTQKFDKIGAAGKSISKIGTSMTKYITLPLAGMAIAAGKFAMDYESAFAGVRKTNDLTEKEYAELSKGIRDMSKELPASAVEIAGVAEAAGQLGIKKENLLDFTRTMIDLGESTNLSATEGATQLARFANITGMSQDKFRNLGSTIVDLGNKFATTEAEIVGMGMRLAGAGKQVGLTEPEIMGFATALTSVGIEAEMGGSAFSKLMINMGVASEVGSRANDVISSTGYSLRDLQMMASHNKDEFGALAASMGYTKEELEGFVDASATLEGFSKVTGKTAAEFQKAFKEDAVGALQSFLTGLGDAESKGKSAIGILDEMGIKEVRLRDTILRATGAKGLFNKAVETGKEAWEKNIALTQEANKRYETTKSKFEIAKNKAIDLGISLGDKLLPKFTDLLDKVSGVVEWFGNLDTGTQDLIFKMGAFAIAAGPVTKAFGGILQGVGKLPKAIDILTTGFGGIAKIGGKLLPTLAKTSPAIAGVGTAAGTAAGSAGIGGLVSGLGTAIGAAAPFIGVAAGVAGAGYLIYKGLQEHATPAVNNLADGVVVTGTRMTEIGGQMVSVAETTSVKISDETKKQMEAYFKLSEGAQKATIELYSKIGPVTDENIKAITANVEGMAEQTKAAIESQKTKNIQDFQDLFGTSTTLTSEQKTKILEDVTTMAEERKKKVEKMRDRIIELYGEIKEKGIENASKEKEELDKLYQEMANEQIRAVAKSKNEQELIISNMIKNKDQMTTKHIEDEIRRLNEERDKSKAATEEKYKEMLDFALSYKTDKELLNGKLSKQEEEHYKALVKEAENYKIGATKEYDNLRNGGIKKLYNAFPELTKNIDIETGKQLGFLTKLFGGADSNAKKINALKYEDKEYSITRNEVTNKVTNYVTNGAYGVASAFYSHRASGLDYVPYDGYRVHLHRGERVLTAEENKVYSNKEYGDININIEKVENNTKEDVRSLVKRIGTELKRQNVGRGEAYAIG